LVQVQPAGNLFAPFQIALEDRHELCSRC
jgi:hypothetical protein